MAWTESFTGTLAVNKTYQKVVEEKFASNELPQ